jgi:hypothetical protein
MTATLNLKNESARIKIQSPSTNEDVRELIGKSQIEDFLRCLQPSAIKFNDYQVFPGREASLFVKGRLIRSYEASIEKLAGRCFEFIGPHLAKEIPSGVILTNVPEKTAKSLSLRAMILMNGDESWNMGPSRSIVDNEELEGYKFPVCSFQCLGQFYKGGEKAALKRLAEGELVLLDYTPEETIPLTKQELKHFNGNMRKLNPPDLGFSLVNYSWHKSGFVLFHDTKEMQCILMGQDEGTYFGVQLPEIVSSVSEALEILVPPEVRGKRYARQGEWFIVEVKDKDLPAIGDRVCNFFDSMGDIVLPLDHEKSNRHRINCDEGFVGKDGRIYAMSPSLEHDEHKKVEFDCLPGTYCTFYKNTAVRSFSQEGHHLNGFHLMEWPQ